MRKPEADDVVRSASDLILRDTMSPEWVERVNAAYEWARDNDRLKDGIYRLPSPYGDPFREM